MSTIPRQVKPERDALNIRLDRDVSEALNEYTQFIASPRDYVIGHALRLVFQKDKEFGTWRAAHGLSASAAAGVMTGQDGRGSTKPPRRRTRPAETEPSRRGVDVSVSTAGGDHAITR